MQHRPGSIPDRRRPGNLYRLPTPSSGLYCQEPLHVSKIYIGSYVYVICTVYLRIKWDNMPLRKTIKDTYFLLRSLFYPPSSRGVDLSTVAKNVTCCQGNHQTAGGLCFQDT